MINEVRKMKLKFKHICIIFLAALLGGFVRTLGAMEINKSTSSPLANGDNSQVIYTNKESSDIKVRSIRLMTA